MLADDMMDLQTLPGLTRAILEARRYVEIKPDYANQIIDQVRERCPEYRDADFLGADWTRHEKNLEVATWFIPHNPMVVRGALYFFYAEILNLANNRN